MSTVPYTFADQTGNIALSQLDDNFSNVKAGVDTAVTVTANAQPNITSVGSTFSVSGNITTGNLIATSTLTTTLSASGNIAGNGVYSKGAYSGAYTSGIVVDYTTGNGRISVGSSEGLNIYNGGVANVLVSSFNADGALQLLAATTVPAGGTAGAGLKMSSTANLGIFFGSGVPTLAAAQGSLYLRTDGSDTSTRMYINTNGSTGWTNVTTAT